MKRSSRRDRLCALAWRSIASGPNCTICSSAAPRVLPWPTPTRKSSLWHPGSGTIPIGSLVCAGLALNCVRAQLHDLLFRGATGFALAYTDTEVFPLASRLWDHWQSTLSSNALGDEYRLVDDFANILGLRQGYEWRTHLPSDPTPPGMRPE